ncbi:MAG: PilZ domain-containing protein [Candidatus Hydrogenedentes bacterium]|nr:PilZ domain-containing protein [Candidatus Hydrogenedentota bacterium]
MGSGSLTGVLFWTVIVCAVLLTLAVVVEWIRQWRAKRARVVGMWDAVSKIAQEKELTTEEQSVLHKLLRRWSPGEPHRAATVHQYFDECVDEEMDALRAKGDLAEFERVGTVLRDIRTRLALDMVPIGQRIFSTRQLYSPQEVWFVDAAESPPRWKRGLVQGVNEAYFGVGMAVDVEPPRYSEGGDVRFRLYRDDDARYSFTAKFVRRESEPVGLTFAHTAELERIQSREHYRVRHEQSTNVGVMDGPVDGAVSETDTPRRIVTRLRGKIVNISAGGLAVVVPQPVPSQVMLRVTVDLPLERTQSFEVDVRIVAVNPLPAGRYLVRAAYVSIDDENREAVARYVMHKQQQYIEMTGQAG